MTIHLPRKYSKTSPVKRFDDNQRQDLSVICNGKVLRKRDYPSEKAWREAAARECGHENPNYNENFYNEKFGSM